MEKLIEEIRTCSACSAHLSMGANPVIQLSADSRIVIIGQAPGRIVHNTGIPWNDRSGDTLRNWLGVTTQEFYDSGIFAIMGMGFCYPGKGPSGDLPPRKECSALWHSRIMASFSKPPQLILLIGAYAQRHYFENKKQDLTSAVKAYKDNLPHYFVLPHPSPRNMGWLKNNSWFTAEVLPELRRIVREIIDEKDQAPHPCL